MANPEKNEWVMETKTLTAEGAAALLNACLEQAKEMNLKRGFIGIFNRDGTLLASRAFGRVLKLHETTACKKAETVITTQRSTSVQRDRMEALGAKPEYYGEGTLGSLFKGGVAIFLDPNHEEFVGAAAAGGGDENQDEMVCLLPVLQLGFYSDIPLPIKQGAE